MAELEILKKKIVAKKREAPGGECGQEESKVYQKCSTGRGGTPGQIRKERKGASDGIRDEPAL